MSRRFFDAAGLLHHLLDRIETRADVIRPLAYVDYDGFVDIAAQNRMVRSLAEAEKAGAIAIARDRSTGDIKHVRLSDSARLYELLGRLPKALTVAEQLAALRAQADAPSAVLDEIAIAWARGVSRFALASGDVEGLAEAITLARALKVRADDGDNTPRLPRAMLMVPSCLRRSELPDCRSPCWRAVH